MGVFSIFDNAHTAWPRGHAERVAPEYAAADARAAFEAGRMAARRYKTTEGYALIESVSHGQAAMLEDVAAALGYGDGADGRWNGLGLYDKLDATAEPVSVFAAGFALEVSRRHAVVLYGGPEMAAALLIADKIAGRDGLPMDPRRITFCTTRAAALTYGARFVSLFADMDFTPRAVFCDEAVLPGGPAAT